MDFLKKTLVVISCLSVLDACSTVNSNVMANTGKIEFDMTKLNQHGLYGPPDGLRSLSYEFCIPAEEVFILNIRNIDPDIKIYRHSPGRIGCTDAEYLCVGDTHNKPYRKFFITFLISLISSVLYRVFLNNKLQFLIDVR